MNTSTIEARKGPGKRLGVFALGLAVACAGMFGLASSQAEAAQTRAPTNQPFQMQLDRGLLNLGAAFVGKEILPAPSTLPTSTSALPNWWDLQTSIGATGILSGASANICSNPAGADTISQNAFFPCSGNPGAGIVQAVGGSGSWASNVGTTAPWPLGTSSTWNPSTGAIALNRVVTAASGLTPNGQPYNFDVRFPIMVVPSPIDGSAVPITLAASGAVTGTFTAGTGALTLEPAAGSSFEARVLVGLGISEANGGPQPFTYCKVPLPGLTLSTTSDTSGNGFEATPFAGGLQGTGALQGTFTVSDNSERVLQTLPGTNATAGNAALDGCGNVDLVTKGSGGIWLGNRVDPPACKEGEIGVYPDCAVPEARISKIAVTGKNSVKRGKKVKLTVRVTNNGTADRSVKVGIFTNSGIVKAPGSVTVNAPAGGTGSRAVTITAKKKKGKVTISASNGERTGKRTVTVK